MFQIDIVQLIRILLFVSLFINSQIIQLNFSYSQIAFEFVLSNKLSKLSVNESE